MNASIYSCICNVNLISEKIVDSRCEKLTVNTECTFAVVTILTLCLEES